MNKTFSRFFVVLSLVFLTSCGVKKMMSERPIVSEISVQDTLRTKVNDSFYRVGNNQLLKNKFGIWELYLEGDAYERGLAGGSLMRELMVEQEDAFMVKVLSMVPSKKRLKLITKFVNLFNRNIQDHITEEYKKELYGISEFNSPTYDTLVPAYIRNLYLHGAHDIGHALQDLMNVGCTSFAVWDDKTPDGELLIGRNFDFHVNDDFNKNKIIAFINPDTGYRFMSYTWPGFMGVVSGMNEHGITVTLNAGKSKLPWSAKTPISLVAREILQYSKTTEDAIKIAKEREVFVSESIMVGSASEGKAILIEVGPNTFGVYDVENSSELVCSNHFQSEAYANNKRNRKAKFESHSLHRFERMEQLLFEKEKITPKKAVSILREKRGVNDSILGMGDERAINQLLAHHGIVFKPESSKVWVSANPYNMGAYVGYDLKKTFKRFISPDLINTSVVLTDEVIEKDPFLETEAYSDYLAYKELYKTISEDMVNDLPVSEEAFQKLINFNPFEWKAYSVYGDYNFKSKHYGAAANNYQKALDLRVTTSEDEKRLQKKLQKSQRRIN